jgi:D-alanyl-D-alanine carboxypeptidase
VTETPWYLVLVNPWYPLPENYEFELTTVTGKYKVDSRCADALKQMLADCKAAGHTPYICSAYRTWDDQVYLFDKKVNSFISKGYSESEAKVLAAKETAVPGTSEHQLGLAVDILCQSRPWLDEGQAKTATQQWLMANCHKYGFILRYPKGTTPITGIIYEPWHYRYVGVEIATEIMTKGITFEEYLGLIGPPEETKTEEITVNG